MAPNLPSILSYFPTFLYNQLWVTPPYPTKSFSDQTVIVTGSNTGLGLEAARHVARLNASTLIIACRDARKGEAATLSIQQSHPGSQTAIEVWPLDLSSYASVKAFADRCNKLPRLDAVIENAGIAVDKYQLAEDNESTLTVNVVSTFLLALLILPKLRATAERHGTISHLAIVSSDVHYFTDFREWKAPAGIFKTLNDPNTADMADRYNVSKMIEILAVREIAKALDASAKGGVSPVVVPTVNPGLCHSELARHAEGGAAIMLSAIKTLLARTSEVGGRTLVAGVTAGREAHGSYMDNGAVGNVAYLLRSPDTPAMQARVWSELGEKLEKIQPGILGNVGK